VPAGEWTHVTSPLRILRCVGFQSPSLLYDVRSEVIHQVLLHPAAPQGLLPPSGIHSGSAAPFIMQSATDMARCLLVLQLVICFPPPVSGWRSRQEHRGQALSRYLEPQFGLV